MWRSVATSTLCQKMTGAPPTNRDAIERPDASGCDTRTRGTLANVPPNRAALRPSRLRMPRDTGECGLRRRCAALTLGQHINDGAKDPRNRAARHDAPIASAGAHVVRPNPEACQFCGAERGPDRGTGHRASSAMRNRNPIGVLGGRPHRRGRKIPAISMRTGRAGRRA
jgi:hypothetical protein